MCLSPGTHSDAYDAATAAEAVDAADEDCSEQAGWRRSLTHETKTTMLLQTVFNCRLPGIVYAVIPPTHCYVLATPAGFYIQIRMLYIHKRASYLKPVTRRHRLIAGELYGDFPNTMIIVL